MSEEDFTCEQCGKSFSSQRGMKVHQAQMHKEDEEKSSKAVESSSQPTDNVKNTSSSISVGIREAMVFIFALGIFIGFSGGLMAGGNLDFVENTQGAPTADTGSNDQPSDTGSNNGGNDNTVKVANLDNSDDPVLGDENAPVTMVYWSDLECPFCQRFEQNTFPQIKSNYVDTGKVKVVFKDYPLPDRIHPWADDAAQALECVYRVGGNDAFWKVQSTIFDNQNQLSTSNVQSQIKEWAANEGVSKSAIQSCIDSGVSGEIQEDMSQGKNRGISGTPGFVIYKTDADTGTRVVGAQPFSRFQTVIDSKLE